MTETQTGETSWWPVITAEAASGWRKLSDDLAAGYDTDRALVEQWWREAWARTFKKPPFWAALPVPAAEVVPPENDGLRLTESGHTDPAAASEGDAAAPDLPGGPTVSEAEGAEPVNAPAGQPDQTALIPVAEDFTQAIPAVTDSTGEATS